MKIDLDSTVEVEGKDGKTFKIEMTKKFVDMVRKHNGLPEDSDVTSDQVKEFLVGSLGNALKELEDGEE
jgi:hypothetical protein